MDSHQDKNYFPIISILEKPFFYLLFEIALSPSLIITCYKKNIVKKTSKEYTVFLLFLSFIFITCYMLLKSFECLRNF